jgi:hypothetical protein
MDEVGLLSFPARTLELYTSEMLGLAQADGAAESELQGRRRLRLRQRIAS